MFLCVLAVGSAAAQEHIPRGQPIPQSVRWVNATATGANARASASWTYGGTTTHHSFPVAYSSSTIGRAAAAAVRRGLPVVGWGLVLRDLVNGAGWLIDEAQKQVVDPGEEQPPMGTQMYCITSPSMGISDFRCATTSGQLCHVILSVTDATTCAWTNRYRGKHGPTGTFDYVITEQFVTIPTNWQQQGYHNDTPYTPTVEISPEQLGELVKAYPEIFNAVMIDPDTGAPIRTPELVDALNDLRRSLEAANGIETPAPDLVPPEDLATPTPSDSPYPAFCDWATVVCEFITWFKTDPDNGEHPELPYEEREVEMVPYNSGLGGGSCPSSTMVPVLDGEVEISWVGICGFVTYLRPLLIACAWILSAFIVVNARPGRL